MRNPKAEICVWNLGFGLWILSLEFDFHSRNRKRAHYTDPGELAQERGRRLSGLGRKLARSSSSGFVSDRGKRGTAAAKAGDAFKTQSPKTKAQSLHSSLDFEI
jgi:hypothetical protein